MASALAKHSGLQEIYLGGTGCFVIAVWSGDVRGGGGEAGAGHACEAGWAFLTMGDVGWDCVLLVTVWCAGNGMGEEGSKALALALAKHSGLQTIDLSGMLCF